MLACALLEQHDYVMKLNTSGNCLEIRFPGWGSLELTFIIAFSLCFGFVWDTALCRQLLCSHHRGFSAGRKRMPGEGRAGIQQPLARSGCMTLRTHPRCILLICQLLELVLRIQWASKWKSTWTLLHPLGSFPRLMSEKQPNWKLGVPFRPFQFSSVQFSSVAQLCPTLCDPMNCSTPGLPVHHQLPEFTQTHVHWVSDAIQASHPLSSPYPPAPNPSQHQSLF